MSFAFRLLALAVLLLVAIAIGCHRQAAAAPFVLSLSKDMSLSKGPSRSDPRAELSLTRGIELP